MWVAEWASSGDAPGLEIIRHPKRSAAHNAMANHLRSVANRRRRKEPAESAALQAAADMFACAGRADSSFTLTLTVRGITYRIRMEES